jgi:hypothetical protein
VELYEKQKGIDFFDFHDDGGAFHCLWSHRIKILQLLPRSCPTIQNL